ncbi:hypothetical protein V5G24_04320 [Xanthobacter sp. VTT E-85241]|uniref:hypothetical protein n=1 Tax=Roseixanthobacter finlandensis TaxID=3119922 RepID=UPI0037264D8F
MSQLIDSQKLADMDDDKVVDRTIFATRRLRPTKNKKLNRSNHMSRIPMPDPFATGPSYPSPLPADYYDEVSDEVLGALRQIVTEEDGDLDGENLEIVAGPAW